MQDQFWVQRYLTTLLRRGELMSAAGVVDKVSCLAALWCEQRKVRGSLVSPDAMGQGCAWLGCQRRGSMKGQRAMQQWHDLGADDVWWPELRQGVVAQLDLGDDEMFGWGEQWTRGCWEWCRCPRGREIWALLFTMNETGQQKAEGVMVLVGGW
jgi:hypothetical protein